MANSVAKRPLRQVQSVRELLVNDMAKKQLASVAASHLKPERMMRLMAGAMQKTPKLAECEPITLLGAMMTCASLGLEPNTVLGHAYLIPFKNNRKKITEVTLIIGYKGMIDLARRSGVVVNIHADVVYAGDEFSFEYGTNQHLRHVPAGPRDNPTHAYCHAKLVDGEAFIVLPYEEVLKVRDSSQGYKTAIKYNDQSAPWIKHEHQMARKTAVRALFNELPISVEKVSDALGADEEQQDFASFAMDPSAGFPDPAMDEDPIEGEAVEVDELVESKSSTAQKQQKKPKQEPKPKPKAQAKKEEPASDPEPEQQEAQENHAPSDDEAYESLCELIEGEFLEAEDAGGVEAVLELYGDQIEPLRGTDYYDRIQDAADKRREEVS